MVERLSAARLDDAYLALANPVRRSLIERMGTRETRVTDLAQPFDISLAAVSKHLRMLERAGLVRRRIDGRDHWLLVDPKPLSAAAEWIERNRRFWEERLDTLEGLLRDSAD